MKRIIKTCGATLLLPIFLSADATLLTKAPSQLPLPYKSHIHIMDGLYAGSGYSRTKNDLNSRDSLSFDALMVFAGYRFLDWISLEGRYTFDVGHTIGGGEEAPYSFSNTALYLKPSYKREKFSAYGLLGLGRTTLDNGIKRSKNTFQWGMGANYAATDKVDVFLDYTKLFDDTLDPSLSTDKSAIESFNLGISYNF